MASPLVKRYLISFDKHKWFGLASLVFVLGGASVYAIQPTPPPQYLVQGMLSYSKPAVTFSNTGSQIQAQGRALSPEVLLSEDVVGVAAKKLGLEPKRIARGAEVKILMPEKGEGVPGQPAEPTGVAVVYLDENQRIAANVVGNLMEQMIIQSRKINTARLRAIIDTINERLPDVEQELRQAEQNLERYDRVEGAALLAAQDGSLVGSITGSQAQERQLELQLDGMNAQIASLEQRLGLNADQAYISSALSADPIVANLRSQLYQAELQQQILQQELRPAHPQMIELAHNQKAYEKLLQERANELISGDGVLRPFTGDTSKVRRESGLDPARRALADQLVALSTQRDTLQQQLLTNRRVEQELRSQFANFPNKQLERDRLAQQIGLKRTLYDKMQAALADARAAEAETVTSLTPAAPPQVINVNQEEKNIPVIMAGGAFLGLVVGGGLIFALAMLDSTFQTSEEIESVLQERELPLLGLLPRLDSLDPGVGYIPVVIAHDSPYAEFYERFRSKLRLAGEEPPRVVALTSATTAEGKTVTAYNLAIASAQAGKRTLLVEANLRTPSEAKSLKVAPDPESALNPLNYYSQPNDCIRLVPEVENLYLVPSPGPQIQAAAILESGEMRRFLENARNRFDLVILDAPALDTSNDALLLEPYTDGLILVATPGVTQSKPFTSMIERLTESETEEFEVLGVAINGADLDVQMVDAVAEPPVSELDDEISLTSLEDIGTTTVSTEEISFEEVDAAEIDVETFGVEEVGKPNGEFGTEEVGTLNGEVGLEEVGTLNGDVDTEEVGTLNGNELPIQKPSVIDRIDW